MRPGATIAGGRRARRRGVALLLVLVSVAFVSVMGAAMLAGSSVQAQMGGSVRGRLQVRQLSESGLNLALYYLRYPAKAPLGAGQTWWRGGTNLSLGADVPGTVDVTIEQDPELFERFTVSSTGQWTAPWGQTYRHTSTAELRVTFAYDPKAAATFNGGIWLPLDAAFKSASVGVRVNGNLSGALLWWVLRLAPTNVALSSSLLGILIPPEPTLTMPTTGFENNYLKYEYDGRLCRADVLSNLSLAASADNPARIFIVDGDQTLGTREIDGTLILRSGKLTVTGKAEIEPRTEPRSGLRYPALIVSKGIALRTNQGRLQVKGLVWTKEGVTQTNGGLSTRLEIEGGLLAGFGASIESGTHLDVEYQSSKAKTINFSTVTDDVNVSVVDWNANHRSGT